MRDVPDNLKFCSVVGEPLFYITFHPAADQVLRRRMLKYAEATAKLKQASAPEPEQDTLSIDPSTQPLPEQ